MSSHEKLTHAVRERLEFIEMQLIFKGWVSRIDLMERFGVAEAAATRDFKNYKEIAENNMYLNHTVKRYEINKDGFNPFFKKTINDYIYDIKESSNNSGFRKGIIESMPKLSSPELSVFSCLSRAICNIKSVKIKYRSLDNGLSEKTISPHSFFDTDLRMYVRCFDKKRSKFIDLLVNRIVSVDDLSFHEIGENEAIEYDVDWNSFVDIKLSPHPNEFNVKNKECVEMDLNMISGERVVSVRKALVAYWLNRWNVDCSIGCNLKDKKYQLCLSNKDVLKNIENSFIAPGYVCD
ncbi:MULTISPECIES: WYL domain-containing protein [Gammaproteobacteria]|uniref:WYL domain-containing protein n=1 Tax=Gammaproteobacteria TaxID=1236 RepID=UPI0005AD27A4|nr:MULTISPECIES: WYL domain-containing protein [Gammaproteobacteria]AJK18503.1 hypothetical protein BZ19_4246 [Yersinia pseudotuberculosis str. PA3606]MDS1056407.1 hypothetical protein [Acinetobacter baumannii]HDL7092903.1 hypothetical protein [Yersinia enterocolitica]